MARTIDGWDVGSSVEASDGGVVEKARRLLYTAHSCSEVQIADVYWYLMLTRNTRAQGGHVTGDTPHVRLATEHTLQADSG